MYRLYIHIYYFLRNPVVQITESFCPRHTQQKMSDYLHDMMYMKEAEIAMEMMAIINRYWKAIVGNTDKSDYHVHLSIRNAEILDWPPLIKIIFFFKVNCNVMKMFAEGGGFADIYRSYFSGVYEDFCRGIDMWHPLGTIQIRQKVSRRLWGGKIRMILQSHCSDTITRYVDKHLELLLDCKDVNKTDEDKKYDNALKYVTGGDPYKIPFLMVMVCGCKNIFPPGILKIISDYCDVLHL